LVDSRWIERDTHVGAKYKKQNFDQAIHHQSISKVHVTVGCYIIGSHFIALSQHISNLSHLIAKPLCAVTVQFHNEFIERVVGR